MIATENGTTMWNVFSPVRSLCHAQAQQQSAEKAQGGATRRREMMLE